MSDERTIALIATYDKAVLSAREGESHVDRGCRSYVRVSASNTCMTLGSAILAALHKKHQFETGVQITIGNVRLAKFTNLRMVE